jgi:hypothetical protein
VQVLAIGIIALGASQKCLAVPRRSVGRTEDGAGWTLWCRESIQRRDGPRSVLASDVDDVDAGGSRGVVGSESLDRGG